MLQSALAVVYPARCLLCKAMTETDFGLCGECWRDTPFIRGLACGKCGAPLPGEVDTDCDDDLCDDCLRIERPWDAGRAAVLYRDNGRRITLGIKHGNRSDLARAAAQWMARAAAPLIKPDTLIVPVPLHWSRLLGRTYNQAAVLARALGRAIEREVCPDALVRTRRTVTLGGLDPDARFRAVADAIAPHPRRGRRMAGRSVLIVDDVMTSGATASAAVEAARQAGASHTYVLHLARAVRGD